MEKRKWLIEARLNSNKNQKDIALELGVTQQAIFNWENGSRTPNPNLAKKIAKILNFDWTKFYEEKTKEGG